MPKTHKKMPLDILGRSHTSHNIKGTTVLAVVHDQQDSQNVIVTGKNDIKLYKVRPWKFFDACDVGNSLFLLKFYANFV